MQAGYGGPGYNQYSMGGQGFQGGMQGGMQGGYGGPDPYSMRGQGNYGYDQYSQRGPGGYGMQSMGGPGNYGPGYGQGPGNYQQSWMSDRALRPSDRVRDARTMRGAQHPKEGSGRSRGRDVWWQ